jgi:hypothetical protein
MGDKEGDKEVIAKARDLMGISNCSSRSDEFIREAKILLLQVADIAEKRGAMLLDREFKDVFSKLPNGTTYSISGLEKQAMQNLDLESASWRKIGPEEEAAIQAAVFALNAFWVKAPIGKPKQTIADTMNVLRRLISSSEDEA